MRNGVNYYDQMRLGWTGIASDRSRRRFAGSRSGLGAF